jgi:hypothetical protein
VRSPNSTSNLTSQQSRYPKVFCLCLSVVFVSPLCFGSSNRQRDSPDKPRGFLCWLLTQYFFSRKVIFADRLVMSWPLICSSLVMLCNSVNIAILRITTLMTSFITISGILCCLLWESSKVRSFVLYERGYRASRPMRRHFDLRRPWIWALWSSWSGPNCQLRKTVSLHFTWNDSIQFCSYPVHSSTIFVTFKLSLVSEFLWLI